MRRLSKRKRNDDNPKTKRSRRSRKWRVLLCLAALLAVPTGVAVMEGCVAVGRAPRGDRFERITGSPNWSGDRFVNRLPPEDIPFWSTLRDFVKGVDHAVPDTPPPVVTPSLAPAEGGAAGELRITWFGHSSTLVELDGRRVLMDPVWSDRVSPVSFMGPKRFHPPPIALDALPLPDVVAISHDHYDHLDKKTVTALGERGASFVVPLGVGSHLEHWGIAPDKIKELDWWDETRVGALRLVATPARHFSGRSPVGADRDKTLWAGFVLIGKEHRVYCSGDTAMFPGFEEIGERLGPFDITMIEIGAYNAAWRDYHIGPEQAVKAHRMVRGELFLPVHWGTFNLALHTWTEPVERLIAAADAAGVALALPKPGESVSSGSRPPSEKWWPDLPWQTAEEAPLVSSGLDSSAL